MERDWAAFVIYMDVQVKGYYPSYKLKEFEREHVRIHMEPGDLETIRKGTVDFIGFSYRSGCGADRRQPVYGV